MGHMIDVERNDSQPIYRQLRDHVVDMILEVTVHPEPCDATRALRHMQEGQMSGRSVLLFDQVDRHQLAALGNIRTASIASAALRVSHRSPRPLRSNIFSAATPRAVR
jgi:hypothetical protein